MWAAAGYVTALIVALAYDIPGGSSGLYARRLTHALRLNGSAMALAFVATFAALVQSQFGLACLWIVGIVVAASRVRITFDKWMGANGV